MKEESPGFVKEETPGFMKEESPSFAKSLGGEQVDAAWMMPYLSKHISQVVLYMPTRFFPLHTALSLYSISLLGLALFRICSEHGTQARGTQIKK